MIAYSTLASTLKDYFIPIFFSTNRNPEKKFISNKNDKNLQLSIDSKNNNIIINYNYNYTNKTFIPVFRIYEVIKTDTSFCKSFPKKQWYRLENIDSKTLTITGFQTNKVSNYYIVFALSDGSFYENAEAPNIYNKSANYFFRNNILSEPVSQGGVTITENLDSTNLDNFLSKVANTTPTVTKSPRPTATLKPAFILPTPTPTPLKKSIDIVPTIICSTNLSTEKEYICPVIDTQRLSFTLIHNIINKLITQEDISSEESASGGVAKARYISKPVKLNSDTTASRLFISFSANVPSETLIRIYYRVFNTLEDPDSKIEEKPWYPIGTSGERKTYSLDKYIDFEFEVKNINYFYNSSLKEFDMFSIKIILESSLDSVVPKVRDFRVIALS